MRSIKTESCVQVMPNNLDCQQQTGAFSTLQGQQGVPCPTKQSCCPFSQSEDDIISALCGAFVCTLANESLASFQQFEHVARACGLGRFWRRPLFDFALETKPRYVREKLSAGSKCVLVRSTVFISRWLSLKRQHDAGCGRVHRCVDYSSLFVAVLGRGERDRVGADDLIPWVEDVADSVLDLTDSYLREPYVDTVLARILLKYGVHLTGILTVTSLRVSGFPRLMERLCKCSTLNTRSKTRRSCDLDLELVLSEDDEEGQDLPDEFSYDDFLAIFGLYWELTAKQCSLDCIRQKDLYEYTPLSRRFLCEVFKVACVRPFSVSDSEISYPDFVWLIVSAEGKGSWPQSAEYLFRVLDLESDGVLTPDELSYFYEEYLRHRSRTFQDVMCEIVDAIRPTDPSRFTLLDIRRSGLAHVFFAPFVDSPDSHRHHRWSLHRRKTSHASWWPTGNCPDPGYWECFVQDYLEYIRCKKDLCSWQTDQPRRFRFAKRHQRSRKRKTRFNSV